MEFKSYILKLNKALCIFLLLSLLPLCQIKSQTMETAKSVNLEKYSGLWYDYAHLPARFLEGCDNITAEYKIENTRYISVYNRCVKSSTGKLSNIKGKAFIEEGSNNAKLKVQFFWPFKAKYWILDIDDDYKYALVGGPSRTYLWVLSRTPEMDEELYNELIQKARALGFPVERMIKTRHK